MLGKDWETSRRRYDVEREKIDIPVGDGVRLAGDLFRPNTDEPVPVILGAHPYSTEFQSPPIKPKSIGPQLAWAESGDPNFFARRGYAHAIINVRGTGKSDGRFRFRDHREIQDIIEAIDWLADRDWTTDSVAMFGVSYYATLQQRVAEFNPDPLDAIFAPWGFTDAYRDKYYHGGILSHEFLHAWEKHVDNLRPYCWSKEHLSDTEFAARVDEALADEEIYSQEHLVNALQNPNEGLNGFITDVVINPVDGEFFAGRRVNYENTEIPAYLGACWGNYSLHLPGAFRSWRNWKGPKKLLIGPDIYLDRPVYQLHDEALRWFDHWIKGVENEVMEEAPISLFLMGEGSWKEAREWPPAGTNWHEIFLHENGLLLDRDHWPQEEGTTYEDSPFRREAIRFETPELVERTEVIGPIGLNLYASTTAEEVLFVVTFYVRTPDGRQELSRGWLRGSQRRTDTERSRPGQAHHPHDQREPLEPGVPYEFAINIRPTANVFQPGDRIGVEIKGADAEGGWDDADDNTTHQWKQALAKGHLARQAASRITVHHNETHPSKLLLPVTEGNRMGLYYSGGTPSRAEGQLPARKIARSKPVTGSQVDQ